MKKKLTRLFLSIPTVIFLVIFIYKNLITFCPYFHAVSERHESIVFSTDSCRLVLKWKFYLLINKKEK